MTMIKCYGMKILMNMFGKAMVNFPDLINNPISVWRCVSIGFSFSLPAMFLFPVCADIIEDLYSPRTAAMDFVNELVRKRGKGNLQKFIQFIVGIFMRYDLVLVFCIYYVCLQSMS